ncbi:MAG TPA: SDR family oxidoreductase [Pseudonocardiaceae bacterium]|jgi:NAD(P)-dependent dehydrogenase (short-subunit alcohol dehydrogenase family)|nr:SDR family oxidoreductase [Pseudonocardiaceae bacterium]
MEPNGKHIVVTGGARGIGRATVTRFAREGARAIVVADADLDGAREVAAEVGGLAVGLDAGSEASVLGLIEEATSANGPIDVYFSNAGVGGPAAGPEAPDEAWDSLWRIHVMSFVWASRALLPGMLDRGEGYLLNTSSAAGLLTQPSALVYTVTKHAAVALAEWLSITYGNAGIRVSCVCPQAVRTRLLDEALGQTDGASTAVNAAGVLSPDDVADAVLAGMRAERLLILPHGGVADRYAYKAAHHEDWLAELRQLVHPDDSQGAGSPASVETGGH